MSCKSKNKCNKCYFSTAPYEYTKQFPCKDSICNYPSFILPGLYLGSTCSRHPYILNDLDIDVIITISDTIKPFRIQGIKNFSYKIKDDPDENIMEYALPDSYKKICSALNQGKNVLVHCQMGISRSASIVIHYIMKRFRMTYSDALRYVRKRRPEIEPNIGFKYQLILLQEIWKGE